MMVLVPSRWFFLRKLVGKAARWSNGCVFWGRIDLAAVSFSRQIDRIRHGHGQAEIAKGHPGSRAVDCWRCARGRPVPGGKQPEFVIFRKMIRGSIGLESRVIALMTVA
jgi:hypothetical protein